MIGILKSGAWGLVRPEPGAPEWLGLSPVIWLVLAGGVVVGLFAMWENRRIARGQAALIDPKMLRNIQLRDGVTSFFFLFLVQAGIFFVVPLFLSVALGLSAVATGVRLLPLSLMLLLFAAGVPKVFPHANPRRVDPARLHRHVRRARAPARAARLRRRSGDRHLAAAARGCRDRLDRLPAGQP